MSGYTCERDRLIPRLASGPIRSEVANHAAHRHQLTEPPCEVRSAHVNISVADGPALPFGVAAPDRAAGAGGRASGPSGTTAINPPLCVTGRGRIG
jgi:hypothetical protein